jgi:hypothetical protein
MPKTFPVVGEGVVSLRETTDEGLQNPWHAALRKSATSANFVSTRENVGRMPTRGNRQSLSLALRDGMMA